MDADNHSFDIEVLEASKTIPVLVDFWAPWCAPCRSLGPVLDKVAASFAGRLRLVKVNSDQCQEIAQRYAVRSIPDVRLFVDGKVVGQFLGALPEGQVRAFIDRYLPPPELALAERAIAEDRLDEAETLLAGVNPDMNWDARLAALRQSVAFARGGGGSESELAAKVAADPADLESRLALAAAGAARKDWGAALEQLIEIVARDKNWRDGEARRQVLAIFNLAADQPDLVSAYRRRFAAALY